MDRSLANNSLRVIYITITTAYKVINNYASEAKYLRELLHLYRDSNETVEKGSLHFRLAKILHTKNKIEEAKAFYGLAVNIMETNGDKQGEALCYVNLGALYHSIGEYDKCRKHLEKALALSIKNGYRQLEATSYGNLGALFQSLDKYDKARERQEKALTITKEIGHKEGEAASYGKLGTLFESLGNKLCELNHFAVHGSDERGEISLSPESANSCVLPREESYLLTMREISQIQLRAKLVVLGCCHSARGEIKTEGVIGIARAFLGSGARSGLASLWALEDEATDQFMIHFYEHLYRGKSVSKSLHRTRKWMRRNGFVKVTQWSPFLLIGDNVTFYFRNWPVSSAQPESQV
ncbi:Tetratricopeptide repeat protein 28 [Stylophora pistillata]|uniref:Tetratricopeptide repeat protein 28 n=1 Tax=Stylophora pistillata TaxID=50429 RepID=A0A2B4R4T6_STYPI|nr:Tetratricopeptide repeat protein 28 [Stylophora pistillata]